MQRRGATTTTYETGVSPTDTRIATATSLAQQNDLIVVTTNRAWSNTRQRTLVQQLIDTGKPVIVVAVRDPYDIAHLPAAETYLATYSYAEASLEAVIKAMYGEISPTGKLPVTIPRADDPSDALYPFGHGLGY
jgi:beta-N-acetylhexosaminidase